jgi:autoinducer 2-degrading protein
MYILQVFIRVKPEHLDAFRAATIANVAASRTEPGVISFDVYQQVDDPTRFTLIEVYHGPEGHAAHRETAHYATWRDTVPDMMAEPRSAVKYADLGV